MQPSRNNLGLVGLGVALVIVGYVAEVLAPSFMKAEEFAVTVGFICIVVGILIWLFNWLRGSFGA